MVARRRVRRLTLALLSARRGIAGILISLVMVRFWVIIALMAMPVFMSVFMVMSITVTMSMIVPMCARR